MRLTLKVDDNYLNESWLTVKPPAQRVGDVVIAGESIEARLLRQKEQYQQGTTAAWLYNNVRLTEETAKAFFGYTGKGAMSLVDRSGSVLGGRGSKGTRVIYSATDESQRISTPDAWRAYCRTFTENVRARTTGMPPSIPVDTEPQTALPVLPATKQAVTHPIASAAPFAVAITSHNRHDVLMRTVQAFKDNSPEGTLIIVVDDASSRPVDPIPGVTVIRNEVSQGIAAAKNTCLAALMQSGVQHFFLADDDCYPRKSGWWEPYITSPEPHLMYQFEAIKGKPLNDAVKLYEDGQHVAYSSARGCFLYYHRSAIERVGGMDAEAFGERYYEHVEHSARIFHAGLTSHRFADVIGSEKFIYSMDEHGELPSTGTPQQRQALLERNAAIYEQRLEDRYSAFVPYRQSDVVITYLLTSQIDSQRNKHWKADLSIVRAWAESLQKHGMRGVLITDSPELGASPWANVEVAYFPPPTIKVGVYFLRWLFLFQYLRENSWIKRVWSTDGSDVECLRNPFPEMVDGVIYSGSETKIIEGEPWMTSPKHHPSKRLQDAMRRYGSEQLLNCGLVGGSREDVMEIAHRLWAIVQQIESERFLKRETPGSEMGEMPHYNLAVYTMRDEGRNIFWGSLVNTVFKAEERNSSSWWKHK